MSELAQRRLGAAADVGSKPKADHGHTPGRDVLLWRESVRASGRCERAGREVIRAQDATDLIGQVVGILRHEGQPRIADRLGQSGTARRDHRQTRGHRLDHRQTETLVQRRQHQHVGVSIRPNQFGVIDRAEQVNALGDIEPIGQVAYFGCLGGVLVTVVADQDRVNRRRQPRSRATASTSIGVRLFPANRPT